MCDTQPLAHTERVFSDRLAVIGVKTCLLYTSTSLHQTLHKVLYHGEVAFVYTDGDGTEHFLKKNKDDPKKYSDQSGLSLTLEIGDENITITDKGDNVMTCLLYTSRCV